MPQAFIARTIDLDVGHPHRRYGPNRRRSADLAAWAPTLGVHFVRASTQRNWVNLRRSRRWRFLRALPSAFDALIQWRDLDFTGLLAGSQHRLKRRLAGAALLAGSSPDYVLLQKRSCRWLAIDGAN